MKIHAAVVSTVRTPAGAAGAGTHRRCRRHQGSSAELASAATLLCLTLLLNSAKLTADLMKPCSRFLHLALIVGVAGSVALAQAAPLTTVCNSRLSVPAAKLVGSNAMVSAVMSGTLHGGYATLVSAQEWVRQYSGESYNSRNRGQALAVRPDGSIVVTGYSYAPATDYDFVTLAYATDGTALWTNRYDSPEHGDDEPFRSEEH